jgi:hypothetical protein
MGVFIAPCRNPTLRECEDETHSRNGVLGVKLQSLIIGVKTPRIGVFFISLEIYRSVDVENGLAWAIWTSTSQVMAKRKRPGIKLTI